VHFPTVTLLQIVLIMNQLNLDAVDVDSCDYHEDKSISHINIRTYMSLEVVNN